MRRAGRREGWLGMRERVKAVCQVLGGERWTEKEVMRYLG